MEKTQRKWPINGENPKKMAEKFKKWSINQIKTGPIGLWRNNN